MLSFSILRRIGVFPSQCELSKWTWWSFNLYRITIFTILVIVTVLMTVQLFVASDLTQLARTIDIWTIFWSGLYKWCFILIFNEDFAKFNTLLVQVHTQGSVIYGQLANRFTSKYLKPGQKVSTLYMFTGIISSILIVLSPLVTYPKG